MSEQQRNRVRASDAEREQIAEAVRHAMSEGRLSLAEGEERLAEVYATTYRDELPRLTADLPTTSETSSAAGPGSGRAGKGPAGRWAGWRGDGRPRPRSLVGVAALAAVAATIWVIATGGPLAPAILLAILAFMLAKRARYGHHRDWHGGRGPCGQTATDATPASDPAHHA